MEKAVEIAQKLLNNVPDKEERKAIFDLLRCVSNAQAQRDILAQAMHAGEAILGFDQDGDLTPAAAIAVGGYDGYAVAFLKRMREQRDDYDAALEEIPIPFRTTT